MGSIKLAPLPDSSDIRHVAIIGAGLAGLAAAKYLIAEDHFSEIDILERQCTVGGVWNTESVSAPIDIKLFPSAVYDDMESNTPSFLMQFSDCSFPSHSPLLPRAWEVKDHLHRYASDVRDRVQLGTEVLNITRFQKVTSHGWTVTTHHTLTGAITTKVYDAVIVANGRYNKAYFPSIPGLREWKSASPASIMHSSDFRLSDRFTNKKIVLVGHGASGVDIAGQVQKQCQKPLLVSLRSAPPETAKSTTLDALSFVPEITDMDVNSRQITYSDGAVETDVDLVIFCTGFDYEYPFLEDIEGFQGERAETANSDTYQHIFWNPDPTLAFVLLPRPVLSFPVAELQAAAIARVWSRRLALPSRAERQQWVSATERKRGTGKRFHKFSYPMDVEYMVEVYHWCMQARDPSKGKTPPFWDAAKTWYREKIREIVRAYMALGEGRAKVTTAQDLGFEWTSAHDGNKEHELRKTGEVLRSES